MAAKSKTKAKANKVLGLIGGKAKKKKPVTLAAVKKAARKPREPKPAAVDVSDVPF